MRSIYAVKRLLQVRKAKFSAAVWSSRNCRHVIDNSVSQVPQCGSARLLIAVFVCGTKMDLVVDDLSRSRLYYTPAIDSADVRSSLTPDASVVELRWLFSGTTLLLTVELYTNC
jgi:hypothetical protein